MSNTFEDMTNAELKEACQDFDLKVKAKNPAKPNKAEYLEALNEFKAKQDAIHGVEPEDETEEVVEAPKPKKDPKSKRKEQTHSQLVKLELMAKKRVIVRDMQENQTKDEMVSVSWGNRLIGRQTDWIDLSGAAQYIRQGALNNLKDASMIVHEAKKGGGDVMVRKNRFVVVDVEAMTEDEIATLSAQQKMRNSKMA